MTSPRSRPWSRGRRRLDDRFGLLLLLVFTYVLPAFASGAWVSGLQIRPPGAVPAPAVSAPPTAATAGQDGIAGPGPAPVTTAC